MSYTIFELERIEKILCEKRAKASDAFSAHEKIVRQKFAKVANSTAWDVDNPKTLGDAYRKHKAADKELALLREEWELFDKGVKAIYSYWNRSVEIFIDNLREKAKPD